MRTAFAAILPVALMAAAYALPAAAEPKIAVIHTQALLRDAPQTKAADAKLKAEFGKRETDLQAEAKKLQEDFKKYQREGDTMSAQQRADMEKNLNTRKIDFDLKQRQFNEDAQNRNQELLRDLHNKVGDAIEQVAKEQGLDLVISDPAFNNPAIDITDAVLKKLAALSDAAPADGGKKKKK